MRGHRKVFALCAGLAALVFGYVLTFIPSIASAFGTYSTTVVALVSAFMAGNYGEHKAASAPGDKP